MDLVEAKSDVYRHPWELSRARQIMKIITAVTKGRTGVVRIADIGAGDLYFSECLADSMPNVRIDAVDTAFSPEKHPIPRIEKYNDVTLLEDGAFDIVVMMDVLEHVEDDNGFIRIVEQKLRKDIPGHVIVTVPAYQKLYSKHDKWLKHFRRYERSTLQALIENNTSLKIETLHFFYMSLYFVRWLQMKLKQIDKLGVATWPYSARNVVTKTILGMLNIDFRLSAGISKMKKDWPGLSLLLVCKTDSENAPKE